MKGFSKTNFLKEYIKLKIDKKDGILKDKLILSAAAFMMELAA